MDDCCDTTDAGEATCPCCGGAGRAVGVAPVRAHNATAADGAWSFCSNPTCRVVFFLDEATIDDDDVVAQVGTKATTKPPPICFCFAHTAAEIRDDLAANHGTSTIQRAVKNAVAAGLCACEVLNPSGACCLPHIHRVVRSTSETLATVSASIPATGKPSQPHASEQ